MLWFRHVLTLTIPVGIFRRPTSRKKKNRSVEIDDEVSCCDDFLSSNLLRRRHAWMGGKYPTQIKESDLTLSRVCWSESSPKHRRFEANGKHFFRKEAVSGKKACKE